MFSVNFVLPLEWNKFFLFVLYWHNWLCIEYIYLVYTPLLIFQLLIVKKWLIRTTIGNFLLDYSLVLNKLAAPWRNPWPWVGFWKPYHLRWVLGREFHVVVGSCQMSTTFNHSAPRASLEDDMLIIISCMHNCFL